MANFPIRWKNFEQLQNTEKITLDMQDTKEYESSDLSINPI